MGQTTFTPASRRIAAIFAGAVVCFAATEACAYNYERNDVRAREIGFVVMRTPVEGLPISLGVRGSARRHIRHIYYGTNLWLGYGLDTRPMFMFGGSIGLETADTAFQKIRGYGEIGASVFWAASDDALLEALAFHTEAGLRWNFRDWARPHWQIVLGVRAFANFQAFGLAAVTGINFNFD